MGFKGEPRQWLTAAVGLAGCWRTQFFPLTDVLCRFSTHTKGSARLKFSHVVSMLPATAAQLPVLWPSTQQWPEESVPRRCKQYRKARRRWVNRPAGQANESLHARAGCFNQPHRYLQELVRGRGTTLLQHIPQIQKHRLTELEYKNTHQRMLMKIWAPSEELSPSLRQHTTKNTVKPAVKRYCLYLPKSKEQDTETGARIRQITTIRQKTRTQKKTPVSYRTTWFGP